MKNTINKWNENIMGTYSPFPIVIKWGKGSHVFDMEDKEYIDFTSGIGVTSLGHGHLGIKKAIKKQVDKLSHISNLYYNKPAADLAQTLCQLTNMDKVFFSNSGAEANEGAIKLARKYSYDKYGEDRNTIITLKKSFHGRTITTLAATGQERFHQSFFPFTQGFKYVEANNIEDLKKQVDHKVCAIMVEAIQGEGGVYPLEDNFVEELGKIAKEKDILLIFDEVQCGVGRTGKFLGCDHYKIKPDIITLAKGLGGGVPIGGFLANKKTSSVLQAGDHGSTYGGNPLVTSAANVVLKEVSKEGFMDEVGEKGEYIKNHIEKLQLANVVEVRGKGLLLGIEIKGDVKKVQEKALTKGLLLLSAGDNAVRLLPALNISYKDLDKGLKILTDLLKEESQ